MEENIKELQFLQGCTIFQELTSSEVLITDEEINKIN